MNYVKIATDLSSNAERVALHNRFADKPTSRFPDTQTAIRRTAQVLKDKKVTAKDIANDSKKKGSFPGPAWKHDNKKLYKLVKENPRRKDTHGYKTFELVVNGMLGRTLREKGGRAKDINWDIKHGYIEVR